MAKIIHPSTGKPINPKNENGKDKALKQVQTVFEDIRIYAVAMVEQEGMSPGVVIAGLAATLDYFKNALKPEQDKDGNGKSKQKETH